MQLPRHTGPVSGGGQCALFASLFLIIGRCSHSINKHSLNCRILLVECRNRNAFGYVLSMDPLMTLTVLYFFCCNLQLVGGESRAAWAEIATCDRERRAQAAAQCLRAKRHKLATICHPTWSVVSAAAESLSQLWPLALPAQANITAPCATRFLVT